MAIPKIIHFIWIGTDLPEKYLHNIISFTSFCKKENIRVLFWTDASSLMSVLKSDIYIPKDITFKDVSELTEYANNCSNGKFKELNHFINKESVGLANFAAAADILRVLALHKYGGIYSDTDNIAIDDIHMPEPRLGFAVASFENQEVINSFIVSEARHEILEMILDYMLQKLNTMSSNHESTLMKQIKMP